MSGATDLVLAHVEPVALALVELQSVNLEFDEIVDRLEDGRDEIGVGARRFVGEDLGDAAAGDNRRLVDGAMTKE